jgi:AcrR family transcriptional regulator
MSKSTTTAILDAAEALFAGQGYDATSIREITRAADVNVAAIHYHFGSKEAVLRGVTDRIVEPLNGRRFALLDAALAAAAPGLPPLEAILDAFIRPDIETLQQLQQRGPRVAHFLGRTYGDPTPWIQEMAKEQFSAAGARFFPILGARLARLDGEELAWRMTQVTTLVVHLFATWPEHGMTDEEADIALARIVAFSTAALNAPPPESDPEVPSPPN